MIICSGINIRQPEITMLKEAYTRYPDGAGYMYASDGVVKIKKGFLTYDSFIEAIKKERFTPADSVVYCFRKATQGNRTQELTQPFPLAKDIKYTKLLNVECPIGVAHSGTIMMTFNAGEKVYSDTSLYISKVLSLLIRSTKDLSRKEVIEAIELTTHFTNKFALMDSAGKIYTVGKWNNAGGIMY